jgi:hypothetical protein
MTGDPRRLTGTAESGARGGDAETITGSVDLPEARGWGLEGLAFEIVVFEAIGLEISVSII